MEVSKSFGKRIAGDFEPSNSLILIGCHRDELRLWEDEAGGCATSPAKARQRSSLFDQTLGNGLDVEFRLIAMHWMKRNLYSKKELIIEVVYF